MFEAPAALLLLLLAFPWIVWSQRREPRPWKVGGLEPFRDLPRGGAARQGLPLSLVLGLLALICAAVGLANPRVLNEPDLVVVDRSYSNSWALVSEWTERSGLPSERDRFVEVGSLREPAAEAELFEAIRLYGAGRRVRVYSDRPAPDGRPDWVQWRNTAMAPTASRNWAILNAWPEPDGWAVHWVRWGPEDRAVLLLDRVRLMDLEGEEAVVHLPRDAGGKTVEIDPESGAPQWSHLDDLWMLGTPAVALWASADERWLDAVRAAWPEARVSRSAAPEYLQLLVSVGPADEESEPVGIEFDTDPFEQEEMEAVAAIARRLEGTRVFFGRYPQPRSEHEPSGAPAVWPSDLLPGGPRAANLGRHLAAAGLLLYGLSLLARRLGR